MKICRSESSRMSEDEVKSVVVFVVVVDLVIVVVDFVVVANQLRSISNYCRLCISLVRN